MDGGRRHPPGPRAPAALQRIAVATRFVPWLERCHARFGDTFALSKGGDRAMVVLAHPDAIEQVFRGDPRDFRAGESNAALRWLFGEGSVVVLDGDPHLAARRLLLPPLHRDALRRCAGLVAELAFEDMARWPVGKPFRLWTRLQAVGIDVILRAVLGDREPADRAVLRDLIARRQMRPLRESLMAEIRRRWGAPEADDAIDVLSTLMRALVRPDA